MLPIAEMAEVVRTTIGLATGRAGFGIHNDVVGGSSDLNAPTVTLKRNEKSVQHAKNRVSQPSKSFHGAAAANLRRVQTRLDQRIRFAPNGRPRRDPRTLFSKEARLREQRLNEFDRTPKETVVPFNLDQLSLARKEQIIEQAWQNGSQLPKGLTPPEPLMRRRRDAALKSNPFMAPPVPGPRRKPSEQELFSRNVAPMRRMPTQTAHMKRQNVPAFGFG